MKAQCTVSDYQTQRVRRLGTWPSPHPPSYLARLTLALALTPAAKMNEVLTRHFTTRQVPHPQCWHDAVSGCNEKIYVAMQGKSEFTLGGQLEFWSITGTVHMHPMHPPNTYAATLHHPTTQQPLERNANINVPTLVMRGEFDTMSEACHNAVVDSIPTAWPLVTIPRAAHCKFLDEPQLCVDAIQKFLNTCDLTRRR